MGRSHRRREYSKARDLQAKRLLSNIGTYVPHGGGDQPFAGPPSRARDRPCTAALRVATFANAAKGTAAHFGRSTCLTNAIGYEPPVSVLLVEDDPLIRGFVVEALREAGYHVIHASTGEEALAWCKRHVADVLVTDVRLPGQVDGWQIAERYREQDPELPVIYATGFSPATPRPVPGSRIVQKPFHPEEIVRMIKELGEEKGAP
ncbi:CheY-like chemotaxis protein [Bradyrhizobium sp. i1.3.1]